jgi:hypothetical protein
MPDIRTDRLDGEASVVKVRGDLDSDAVAAVAQAEGIPTVIDLLDATLVDVYALDALRLRTESSLGAAFP